jgi:putative methyltransferase
VRCSPGEDATNGFFVACFVRKDSVDLEAPAVSGATKRKVEEGSEGNESQGKKKKRKRRKHGAKLVEGEGPEVSHASLD